MPEVDIQDLVDSAGVLSGRSRPGPYSEQETMNNHFTRWYLDKINGRCR